MAKIILIALTFAILFIALATNVSAQAPVPNIVTCNPSLDRPDGTNPQCKADEFCLPATADPATNGSCEDATVRNKFGKIPVPGVLGGLIKNNPTGAGAISQFLTNFIILLYSIAAIVLVFMLVWAAFEWLTSGGDKEKIAAAQKRILHAIIGIILFAVAFAIIRILGVFTGFKFFKENIKLFKNPDGSVYRVICPDGTPVGGGPGSLVPDPVEACKTHS